MNFLKSKTKYLAVFSLVIGFIALVMIGCEENESENNIFQKTNTQQVLEVSGNANVFQYYPPVNIRNQSLENFDEYINNLNSESRQKLIKSYNIFRYLKDIDMLRIVENELDSNLMLADADLANYLSKEQIEDLANYSVVSNCCPGGIWQGNNYRCGCSGNWEYCAVVICPNGDEQYCNCYDDGTGPCRIGISPDDNRNLSEFIATKMNRNGKSLISTFIKYQKEIENIMSSEDVQYASVQDALNVLMEQISSLNEGFTFQKSTYLVTKEDINIINTFLTELENVTNTPQLKHEVKWLLDNTAIMEGKNVLNALKAFDQIKR